MWSWFNLHALCYVEGFQKCSIGVLGPVARVACWGQLGLFDQSSGLECPTPSILLALQVRQGLCQDPALGTTCEVTVAPPQQEGYHKGESGEGSGSGQWEP